LMLLNNNNKNLIDHPMIRYLFKLMAVCLIALGVLNIAYGEKMELEEAWKEYKASQDSLDAPLFFSPSFMCSATYQKTNDPLLQNKRANETIICEVKELSFQDGFSSSFYQAIIKGNPKLKARAKKIMEAMLDERDNQCSAPADDFFEDSNILKHPLGWMKGTLPSNCISRVYDDFIYQMLSFLYENDKTLFERIFGKDKFFSDFIEKYPTYKKRNYNEEEQVRGDPKMQKLYDDYGDEFQKTHNGF
ncbi:hypothetical protein, partial [Helicobacter sp. 12S02232-10]|uniref:hypothetical protein n=1 Tax=Helicobacter sp. 12S02232-10 TaxID=1476197 RepID=UPI0015DEA5AC